MVGVWAIAAREEKSVRQSPEKVDESGRATAASTAEGRAAEAETGAIGTQVVGAEEAGFAVRGARSVPSAWTR